MLDLNQIKKVINVSRKIESGMYSRMDIESLEALIPGSIESDVVSVKEIPMYDSNTLNDILLSRVCKLNDSVRNMLDDYNSKAIKDISDLVSKLLVIRDILNKVKDSALNPVKNIDKIMINSDQYGYLEMTNPDIDYSLERIVKNEELLLMSSNDMDIDVSVNRLKMSRYESRLDLVKRTEWSGYIIKDILGVDKITYNVVCSLLNNPLPMITAIDTVLLEILNKTADSKDYLEGYKNSNISDIEIEKIVELDSVVYNNSKINGYSNDNTSSILIELMAKARYSSLI